MSAKKKQDTKTDWQQVAQSMHRKYETLFDNLKSILELADRMIKFVDEKHPEPIKKVLTHYKSMSGNPSLDNSEDFANEIFAHFVALHNLGMYRDDSLNEAAPYFGALEMARRIQTKNQRNESKDATNRFSGHYVMIHRLDMVYEDSLIAESYFGALGTLARIQSKTNFIARYFHECRNSRVNTIEFIENILTRDYPPPQSFMNDVVPLFFSLQLHCHNLLEIAKRPAGVPADPRVRKNRSSTAAEIKNYGEDVLKGEILDFLISHTPERKYRSIEDMYKKLAKNLEERLNSYLDRLESPIVKGGIPLSYQLTVDGILRKLREWKNEDPEFKKHLERICVIR